MWGGSSPERSGFCSFQWIIGPNSGMDNQPVRPYNIRKIKMIFCETETVELKRFTSELKEGG
jgi:hypothetical protein